MQHDFILLDRSGSMSSRWDEALGAVNTYVQKLAEDKVDTGITLAVFDTSGPFDIIRDRITPATWAPVTSKDAEPRSMTPLNDAIGRMVTHARLGHNGQQYDKVAMLIVTDGAENASKEYTHVAAKALLDDCRSKGWQVLFIGADFDNAQQAASYGNLTRNTVAAGAGNLGATMSATASLRGSYASGQSATMDFSDDQKAELKKDKKKA